MEFKEFGEYTNPEKKDYDISSSLYGYPSNKRSEQDEIESDFYSIVWYENVTDEELTKLLQEEWGLTLQEYLHPTKETLKKVSGKTR